LEIVSSTSLKKDNLI